MGWPSAARCSRIWWVRPVAGQHCRREVPSGAWPMKAKPVRAALPSGWQMLSARPGCVSTGSEQLACPDGKLARKSPRTRAAYSLVAPPPLAPGSSCLASRLAATLLRATSSKPLVTVSSRCGKCSGGPSPSWRPSSVARLLWWYAPQGCTGSPGGLFTTPMSPCHSTATPAGSPPAGSHTGGSWRSIMCATSSLARSGDERPAMLTACPFTVTRPASNTAVQ
mmetsp:Transcript_21987/g.56347  ORF Transcript_21987/g.56347 Transcript_21987/m.56347 type:complete len:223 (+) Transcript_21987:691-1359(+)